MLLTLVLSLQASYAAPLILLAQNRQEGRDRTQAELDRSVAERTRADTEFLAREIAGVRLMLADAVTGDELREQLADLQGRRRQARQARRHAAPSGDAGRRATPSTPADATSSISSTVSAAYASGCDSGAKWSARSSRVVGAERRRQRPLLARAHEVVTRRDEARGRHAERRRPRPGVVVGERPAGVDHDERVVARHLADEPRDVRLHRVLDVARPCGADHLRDGPVEVAAVALRAQPRAGDRQDAPQEPVAAGVASSRARSPARRARRRGRGGAGRGASRSARPSSSRRRRPARAPSASNERGGVVGGVLERERGPGERRPRPWPRWSMPTNV